MIEFHSENFTAQKTKDPKKTFSEPKWNVFRTKKTRKKHKFWHVHVNWSKTGFSYYNFSNITKNHEVMARY